MQLDWLLPAPILCMPWYCEAKLLGDVWAWGEPRLQSLQSFQFRVWCLFQLARSFTSWSQLLSYPYRDQIKTFCLAGRSWNSTAENGWICLDLVGLDRPWQLHLVILVAFSGSAMWRSVKEQWKPLLERMNDRMMLIESGFESAQDKASAIQCHLRDCLCSFFVLLFFSNMFESH